MRTAGATPTGSGARCASIWGAPGVQGKSFRTERGLSEMPHTQLGQGRIRSTKDLSPTTN